jgi:hypothetical protein
LRLSKFCKRVARRIGDGDDDVAGGRGSLEQPQPFCKLKAFVGRDVFALYPLIGCEREQGSNCDDWGRKRLEVLLGGEERGDVAAVHGVERAAEDDDCGAAVRG